MFGLASPWDLVLLAVLGLVGAGLLSLAVNLALKWWSNFTLGLTLVGVVEGAVGSLIGQVTVQLAELTEPERIEALRQTARVWYAQVAPFVLFAGRVAGRQVTIPLSAILTEGVFVDLIVSIYTQGLLTVLSFVAFRLAQEVARWRREGQPIPEPVTPTPSPLSDEPTPRVVNAFYRIAPPRDERL